MVVEVEMEMNWSEKGRRKSGRCFFCDDGL